MKIPIINIEIDKKGIRWTPEKKGAGQFDGLTDIQRSVFRDQINNENVANKLWVASACIQMRAEGTASLPYQVQDLDGNKIEDDQFNRFMDKPNISNDSGRDLIEAAIVYYLTNGNGYFWKNAGITIDYYTLMSNNVNIIGDKNIIENILRYKYYNNGLQATYQPDEIIHIKSFNPNSRISGQSALTAAASEIGLLNKMNKYQNSIYDNQGQPSGSLTTDDIFDDDERNRLKRSIRSQIQGVNNAGDVMVLERGLEYKSLAFNPTDLGILKSELINESAVATLLKTPIELLGALAEKKNVSNYKESDRRFMKTGVLPLGEMVASALTWEFFSDGKGNLDKSKKIVIPKNQIDELKPTNEDLATQDWTTPNQKRAMQGMRVEDGPDAEFMDKYYIDGSKSEISNLNDIEDNTEI